MSYLIGTLNLSPQCLTLFNKFKLLRVIAKNIGSVGVIYHVIDLETGCERVLKAISYSPGHSESEVEIGYKVSKLAGYIKLHNWFVCDTAPNDWLIARKSSDVELHGDVLYLVMDKAHGSLHDLLIDIRPRLHTQEAKSIIFEILYAIYVGWVDIGLCHMDIKPDNILFTTNIYQRSYTTPSGQHIKSESVYQPLLADFGESKISQHKLCWIDQMALERLILDNFAISFANDPNYNTQLKNLTSKINNTIDYTDVIDDPFFASLY
jgi:serine/threonine protein kinase